MEKSLGVKVGKSLLLRPSLHSTETQMDLAKKRYERKNKQSSVAIHWRFTLQKGEEPIDFMIQSKLEPLTKFGVFQLEENNYVGFILLVKPLRETALRKALPGALFTKAVKPGGHHAGDTVNDQDRLQGPWTWGVLPVTHYNKPKKIKIPRVRKLVSHTPPSSPKKLSKEDAIMYAAMAEKMDRREHPVPLKEEFITQVKKELYPDVTFPDGACCLQPCKGSYDITNYSGQSTVVLEYYQGQPFTFFVQPHIKEVILHTLVSASH